MYSAQRLEQKGKRFTFSVAEARRDVTMFV